MKEIKREEKRERVRFSAPCTLHPAPLLLGLALIALRFTLYATPAYAQFQGAPFDVVTEFTVADQQAQDGDILSSTDKGLSRANSAYDIHLFGVIQSAPVVVFRPQAAAGKPIARSGIVEVNVSTANGPIKEGDYITSSELPGWGQKATVSGYVIGTALANFDPSVQSTPEVDYNPKSPSRDNQPRKVKIGKIPVALNVDYANLSGRAQGSLLNIIGGLFSTVSPPEKFTDAAKFIIAGLIVIGSFLFGFLVFARAIPKGIEAIGRNPLAQRAIQFSIILHIFFTIVTTIIGVIAAVLVIRL